MSGNTKRTIDSPVNVCGEDIKPNDILNRSSNINIHTLLKNNIENIEPASDTYNSMRVEGTYMDGSFIKERAGEKRSDTYYCPDSVDIYKTKRYVILLDFQTGYKIPILEDRFQKLVENNILITTS